MFFFFLDRELWLKLHNEIALNNGKKETVVGRGMSFLFLFLSAVNLCSMQTEPFP